MSMPGRNMLHLCGVGIDPLQQTDLVQLLEEACSTRKRALIFNHNLHSLFLYKTDSAFRNAYKSATSVYIDGLPIVWLGQAAGLPLSPAHRITLLDSFEAVLAEASERGWRVFYLGSSERVLTKALQQLRARFPKLSLHGRDGFFDKDTQSREVIAEINEYQPDLLFVGMGMPLQETWLSAYQVHLNAPAILTCGATLDYVIGEAYKPPAWAGPLGLYGVARLFSDPKRLWRRYLLEPLWLLRHLGLEILQQRIRSRPLARTRGDWSKTEAE